MEPGYLESAHFPPSPFDTIQQSSLTKLIQRIESAHEMLEKVKIEGQISHRTLYVNAALFKQLLDGGLSATHIEESISTPARIMLNEMTTWQLRTDLLHTGLFIYDLEALDAYCIDELELLKSAYAKFSSTIGTVNQVTCIGAGCLVDDVISLSLSMYIEQASDGKYYAVIPPARADGEKW